MSKSIFELYNEQNPTPKESKDENISFKDEKEESEKIVVKEIAKETVKEETETSTETTTAPETETPKENTGENENA